MEPYELLMNSKVVERFLPRTLHRNLKYATSIFLILYPLPYKKIKVYKKLNDKQKISFIMKFFLSTLYKEKVDKYDINFYKTLKNDVNYSKSWSKHLKVKSNLSDINDEDYNWTQLKKGIKIEVSDAESKKLSELLTKTTIKLMWQLINKKYFLIDNMKIDRYK